MNIPVPVRIGMDTSKSVFRLHGVDENEVVVVRRQFRRAEMIRFFERLPPVLVAIESCGSSHHWARLLQSVGHEVKLIPPQYVKPYMKRGKNDAADAEALCEAVTRPSRRFVSVKSKERQAACMLMTVHKPDRWITECPRLGWNRTVAIPRAAPGTLPVAFRPIEPLPLRPRRSSDMVSNFLSGGRTLRIRIGCGQLVGQVG